MDGKRYKQGRTVFVPKSAYRKDSVAIAPITSDYKISYDSTPHFFFPGTVHAIAPRLTASCYVRFNNDLSVGSMFTLVGHEDDVFGNGGVPNTFMLSDGETITLQIFGQDKLCTTNKVVRCDSGGVVDLGMVRCAS